MNVWHCYSCGSDVEPKSHYCDPCLDKLDRWARDHPAPEINLHAKVMVKCGDMTVSQARVDELERRTILPYDAPDGGYYVGRKGENGKISEREPDYRP